MKYTKGKVIVKNRCQIFDEDGYLFTVSMRYNSDNIEYRLKGESWLDMRKRTKHLRDKAEERQQKTALFFSKAPEMYEALKIDYEFLKSVKGFCPKPVKDDIMRRMNLIESLLKELES